MMRGFTGMPLEAATVATTAIPPMLLKEGMSLGPDEFGRPFYFDPWVLKVLRITSSMIYHFFGQKGAGKTALLKTIVSLLMMLQTYEGGQPKVRINDRKPENGQPEWAPLARALGCTTVPLKDQRLNIFDPRLVKDRVTLLGLSKKVIEIVLGRSIDVYENLTLQIAADMIYGSSLEKIAAPDVMAEQLRKLNDDDHSRYFEGFAQQLLSNHQEELEGDPTIRAQLNLLMGRPDLTTDMTQLKRSASNMNAALMQVISGVHGEMFSGRQSMYDILTMPALVLDWTGVEEEMANLMHTIMLSFDTAAVVGGIKEIIPTILVSEEDHESMMIKPVLEAKAARYAKSRSTFTFEASTTQTLSGIKAGEPDSYLRRLSDRVSQGTDGMFIGAMPDTEANREELVSSWNVSPDRAAAIPGYEQGGFEFVLRNSEYGSRRFHHAMTHDVLTVAQSESANEAVLSGRRRIH